MREMYAIVAFSDLLVLPQRRHLDLNVIPKMIRSNLYSSISGFTGLRTLILGRYNKLILIKVFIYPLDDKVLIWSNHNIGFFTTISLDPCLPSLHFQFMFHTFRSKTISPLFFEKY